MAFISTLKVAALKEEALGHEEDVVPTVKAEVPVPEGSVGPETEGIFAEASEVEIEGPPGDPETPTLTIDVVEPSIPTPDLFTERTQPSPLRAITQGSHRPKQFLPSLRI